MDQVQVNKNFVENVRRLLISMGVNNLNENARQYLEGYLDIDRRDAPVEYFNFMPVQYNYDQSTNEFVANPSGEETGNITGNRVFVTNMDGELRYKVEIDDFGCVVAAFNRLCQRLVITFQFPD